MGLLDAILGRRKPREPDLDALFSLPGAAVGLEVEMGLRPTGTGSVCFRAAEGPGFAAVRAEVETLLTFGDGRMTESKDSYGYTWLACTTSPDDLSGLVTALHGANATIASAGFGPSLLCSVVSFAGTVEGASRTLGLVYLYKRGSFYPFVPVGPERRDTSLELRTRSVLGSELPVEPDLSRWFPVWGAPGL